MGRGPHSGPLVIATLVQRGQAPTFLSAGLTQEPAVRSAGAPVSRSRCTSRPGLRHACRNASRMRRSVRTRSDEHKLRHIHVRHHRSSPSTATSPARLLDADLPALVQRLEQRAPRRRACARGRAPRLLVFRSSRASARSGRKSCIAMVQHFLTPSLPPIAADTRLRRPE